MATLTWGKPKLEIQKYVNGAKPAPTVGWTAMDTPKENTTQLSTAVGDTVEAKEEGGGTIDSRRKKNKYTLSAELFVKRGFTRPIEDNDGVVVENYAIRLTPEDSTLEGYLIDKASVSVEEKFTTEEGTSIVYTFDALVPDDKSKMLKPYLAPKP